ncbi:hypothetical protein GMST_33220 [Geomonas silvestris]|uniref:Endonuclease/exonuclease/phosphatase domain-containing protein n=1 Tax=Geomonas silvestris TaxID=2740184 RepID=A0A6V8MMA6_9BACT|nr:endonuclease/exonuclease/phosphatase family protein [Geomonas silvestris]GFO60997.1 hypothetical protein GMST_33220 [Geomonas silvestris]
MKLPWLIALSSLYLAFLTLITLLNWTGADRYWFGALNLYLPQAMWALPGLALAVLAWRGERFWALVPLCCVVWVLGPLMGVRWSGPPAQAAAQGASLRLMTWNIKYGSYPLEPLFEELDRSRPDVVLFQDAVGALGGTLAGYLRDWQVYSHGQFVIASRYPLSDLEVRELPRAGEGQEYLRCRLHLGEHAVALYNVHFKTPRRSLNEFRTARKRPWYLPKAIEALSHNAETRQLQAAAVARALKEESGPVLVAGDFNAPVATRVVGMLREQGLKDAFDERGRGYGFSYGQLLFKHRLPWLRLSFMRIDHVMSSREFGTQRCWTGTGRASDHRPVLADLVLLPGPRR